MGGIRALGSCQGMWVWQGEIWVYQGSGASLGNGHVLCRLMDRLVCRVPSSLQLRSTIFCNCFLLVHVACLITQPASSGDLERLSVALFPSGSTNWMTMCTCLRFML